MEVKLLDHGFCRLIDSMGSDLAISRAARVSHDADWRAGKDEGSDYRLIDYLWKNWHTTPFEAVVLTFEVQAPIFVFRQWHRHRTQSYNELSARYQELPELFYVPDPAMVGAQDPKNKQARLHTDAEAKRRHRQCEEVRKQNEAAFGLYRELLADGWPRELARSHLPVSTYSRMFCTMNLLNLFRFVSLRSTPHAQYEIKVYSDAMLTMAKVIAPAACATFLQYEMKMVERLEA